MIENRTPGLERKACERCRRLKCKCDGSTPCGACASHNAECIRLVRKRPVREKSWFVDQGQNKRMRSNSVDTPSSTLDSALELWFGKSALGEVSVGRGVSFCEDGLLPDMTSMLHDLFSTLNRPQPSDWTSSTGHCSLHRLFSTPNPVALSRIDPLEAHRLTIINHLAHSPYVQPQDLPWFTLTNLRHSLIAFFRHCHRHLPIIHLPTWDIATIPSSLVLVQAMMGSVYMPNPSENALRARRLITDAFSLIFAVDDGFHNEAQPTPSIESMQALGLLASVAGWYVTISEGRQVRKQYDKIVRIVRNSGFLRPVDNNPKPAWEQWVYEEKRRRAMSLLYMLDCGFVMFFGDRPRFMPYEIQHCLPAHEHVYQASSASEWSTRFVATNPRPFPELLNAVLSPFQDFPKDVSAAGLHAAIWTQKHNVLPNHDKFKDERYQMISAALNKWKNSWFSRSTIHEQPPHAGLYEEGNFKWWMVANWLLHHRPAVDADELEGREDERVANVYRILKACQTAKRTGIEEGTIQPEELLKSLPEDVSVNHGLDTLTKKFMITATVV